MPFKTILSYFGQDNSESTDSIIIQNKLKKKTPSKSLECFENDQEFLSNFTMPKTKLKDRPVSTNHKIKTNTVQELDDDEKILYVYTDGSCILNGKPNARGSWAIYFPGGEFPNQAEKYTNHPTNQRCELTAIWKALEIINSYIEEGGKAELYTDSEYSLKCLTEYCRKWSQNGWIKADKKPIENRDIIEPLYHLYMKLWKNVKIKHIRAHTGNLDKHSIANDMVDQLARQALTSNN